jgi:hypothetical protein
MDRLDLPRSPLDRGEAITVLAVAELLAVGTPTTTC